MATPSPASSHLQDVYEKCVDALNTLFGAHAGFRATHAKGVLCDGHFHTGASRRVAEPRTPSSSRRAGHRSFLRLHRHPQYPRR